MLPGLSGHSPLMLGGGMGGGGGGSLTGEISIDEITKTASTRGGARVLTTIAVFVTPSGGAGGYAYSWARISGDAEITAGTPLAAGTTFSATVDPDEYKEALFECIVTDAAAQTVTVYVTVKLQLVFRDPFEGGTL